MRNIPTVFLTKQEECVVLLRSIHGFHILNAPLDMSDLELLDMLCAAQEIVTQRIATKGTTSNEPTTESISTDLQ
jgi:hypothetical protein